MSRNRLISLSALCTVLIWSGTTAIGQTAGQLSSPDAVAPVYAPFTDPQNVAADLARIDAALNSTETFEGRFTQYNSNGEITTGQIFLTRPGRMRFEYDEPNPMLVVSDGVTLVQHDKRLETTDRVPLSATPLNYFLKENVDLARDTEVISLIKTAEDIRVTSRDGSGEMDGVITMVFDANTLAFKAWIITDGMGLDTRVALSDLRYNGNIDPRLYVFREDSRRNNNRDRRR